MLGTFAERIKSIAQIAKDKPPAGYSRSTDRISLRYYDPQRGIYRVIADAHGWIQNPPGFAPEVYLDIERFPKTPLPRVIYRCDEKILADGRALFLWEVQPDGRYWADDDGFGMENDEEIILYSVMRDGRLTTPFRYYSVGVHECFDPQEGMDPEEGKKRWNEMVCMIVRLAFCGKVWRRNDHYAVQLGVATLNLSGAKMLTDVCLQYYRMADSVKKDIAAEYARTWNSEHVLKLAQDPAPYLPQMEQVYAQIRSEPAQMRARPVVPKELFWICPRRTAQLAMEIAEKDMKNAREGKT